MINNPHGKNTPMRNNHPTDRYGEVIQELCAVFSRHFVRNVNQIEGWDFLCLSVNVIYHGMQFFYVEC
jgi:hypothetical protein